MNQPNAAKQLPSLEPIAAPRVLRRPVCGLVLGGGNSTAGTGTHEPGRGALGGVARPMVGDWEGVALHRVHPTPPSLLLPWRGDSGGGGNQQRSGCGGAMGQGPPTARGQRSAGESVLTTDARGGKEIREAAWGGGKETDGSIGRRDGKAQSHAGVRNGPPRGQGVAKNHPTNRQNRPHDGGRQDWGEGRWATTGLCMGSDRACGVESMANG